MAASEPLAIEPLSADDEAGGLVLSDAAGWNQTADDWALFIEQGQVLGCRDADGRLVATAAALPYGASPGANRVGWVSMVLVAERHRHRGLATRLLDACVESLQQRGCTALLDATAAGREVYQRNGFVGGFEFERWEGEASDAAGERIADVGAASEAATREDDFARIVALDSEATSVGRAFLLRSFMSRPDTFSSLTRKKSGFVVARAGRRATQIGPLVAADEGDARALLVAALEASRGRVFIDLPVRWRALAGFVAELGFTRQRSFTRMALGSAEAASRLPQLAANDRVFALAGPEFG